MTAYTDAGLQHARLISWIAAQEGWVTVAAVLAECPTAEGADPAWVQHDLDCLTAQGRLESTTFKHDSEATTFYRATLPLGIPPRLLDVRRLRLYSPTQGEETT